MYLEHFGLRHALLGKEALELWDERARFALLIAHALKNAGCGQTLMADSGLEILRQASKRLPRQTGRILCTAMRLAVPKGLNHLPDDLLQQAIGELQ